MGKIVFKFRAWVSEFHKDAPDKTPTMMDWKYLKTWTFDDFLSSGATIMLFTGLNDKNGTEIYEGDILQFPFNMGIGIVVWNELGWWIESPGSEARNREGSETLSQTTIIGNIYENPELLNP